MRRNAQLRAAFLEELPRSRFHCATIPEAAPFSFVSSVRELLPPWNKLVINFCELLDVLPPAQLDHYLSSMLSCNSDGLEMPTFSSSFLNLGYKVNQSKIFTTRFKITYYPLFAPLSALLEEKPGEGREGKFVRARPRFASVVEAVGRVSGAPLSAACSPFPRFQHNSISRFILQARCYLVRPPEFPRRPRIIRHLPSYNNGTTEGLAPTPPTPPPPPPALAAMPEHWYWLIFPTVM